jgi:hypothetical protein
MLTKRLPHGYKLSSKLNHAHMNRGTTAGGRAVSRIVMLRTKEHCRPTP